MEDNCLNMETSLDSDLNTGESSTNTVSIRRLVFITYNNSTCSSLQCTLYTCLYDQGFTYLHMICKRVTLGKHVHVGNTCYLWTSIKGLKYMQYMADILWQFLNNNQVFTLYQVNIQVTLVFCMPDCSHIVLQLCMFFM